MSGATGKQNKKMVNVMNYVEKTLKYGNENSNWLMPIGFSIKAASSIFGLAAGATMYVLGASPDEVSRYALTSWGIGFSLGEAMESLGEAGRNYDKGELNTARSIGYVMRVAAPIASVPVSLSGWNPVLYAPILASWISGFVADDRGRKKADKEKKSMLKQVKENGLYLEGEIEGALEDDPEKIIDVAARLFTTKRAREMLAESESFKRNV